MIDEVIGLEEDLDERVAAFEREWHAVGSAKPEDYLPEPDAPHYQRVLCELLRCDLELHWSHGQPGSIDSYRGVFPVVFDDPRQLSALAFEEYRQKVRAGQGATPQDYAEKYGLDVSEWPTPDDIVEPTIRTQVSDDAADEALRELSRIRPEAALNLQRSRRAMPHVGEKFLHFELVSELGCGAFGRVFLARQKDLANRYVAVK